MSRRFLSVLPIAAIGIFVSGNAVAQTNAAYPLKPVRIVLGFPPGGATDILSRDFAAKLGDVTRTHAPEDQLETHIDGSLIRCSNQLEQLLTTLGNLEIELLTGLLTEKLPIIWAIVQRKSLILLEAGAGIEPT